MSSNAVWFTYHLEFDLVAQAGAVTEQACKQAVRDLALDQKVQVIPLKTPRTRTVYGVDVRYAISGPQMLTTQQIAALDAQLRSVFAMYFVPATPDPLILSSGLYNGVDGMVFSNTLPYVSGKDTQVLYRYTIDALGANTGITGGFTDAGAGGNVYAWSTYDIGSTSYAGLVFNVSRAASTPVTMLPAAATVTLKDALGTPFILLPRTNDIVVSPIPVGAAYGGFLAFFVSTAGKLYLSQATDATIVSPADPSWNAVVQNQPW